MIIRAPFKCDGVNHRAASDIQDIPRSMMKKSRVGLGLGLDLELELVLGLGLDLELELGTDGDRTYSNGATVGQP